MQVNVSVYRCILVIQTVFNLLAGDIRDSKRLTLITVKTANILNFVNILAKNIFPAKLQGMMTVFIITQPSMHNIVEKSKLFFLEMSLPFLFKFFENGPEFLSCIQDTILYDLDGK